MMPTDSSQHRVRLVSLGPGDGGRVRAWLALPAVLAWWGTRSRAEAEIALAADSPSAICRIVRCDDQPVGYAQAVDGALLDGGSAAESGAWECTTFIASEAHRGQGLGEHVLRALIAEVFGSTLAVACIMRIPISKEPAVRAVEAAGFKWVRIEQDAALGRVWLMRCERPRR